MNLFVYFTEKGIMIKESSDRRKSPIENVQERTNAGGRNNDHIINIIPMDK